MRNASFLTIVCPVYNEQKYIEQCIESILVQDFPRENLEVLFVDGMSSDETRQIISSYIDKYSFIRMLDNPERIVSYAMNIGIMEAKGDVIMRLDAHAIYPSNYFSTLVDALYKLNADNVGAICRTLPARETPKCKAIAIAMSSAFGVGNSYFRIGTEKVMEVDTVPFGCYRKNVFEEIGMYDVELVRNQDDELNARLIKHGGKIYLLPNLVIDYYARDTFCKTWKMFYQYGLYKPLVNRKLGSPATFRQFVPLLFVVGVIVGGGMSFVNIWLLYAYCFVLLLYVMLGVFIGVRANKKVHDWRLVFILPVAFGIIHFAYGIGHLCGIYKVVFRKSFNVSSNR